MENELDLLLGRAIDSLSKLEVLLHLTRVPNQVQSAKEFAVQLQRPVEQVSRALEELSGAGLVDRFALGTGKHVLYGAPGDGHARELLQLLHARCQDAAYRAQIVREALRGNNRERETDQV